MKMLILLLSYLKGKSIKGKYKKKVSIYNWLLKKVVDNLEVPTKQYWKSHTMNYALLGHCNPNIYAFN